MTALDAATMVASDELTASTDNTTHIKILVVGPGRAGKTAWCQRYCNDLWYKDGRYLQTLGGQENAYAAHPAYFRDAHAAIVMMDITDTESAKGGIRWKDTLEKNREVFKQGGVVPTLLVANKRDLHDQRKFTPDQLQELTTSHNFSRHIETSAKTNLNLTAAVHYLIDEVMNTFQLTTQESRKPFPDSPQEGKKAFGCSC